jgi:hypothetical protein
MENIGSITYRPELNQVYLRSRRIIRFFEQFDPTKIQEFIKLVLSGITPAKELDDIHLEAFLGFQERMNLFIEDPSKTLGILVYPRAGEIKEFQLNPETEFLSNIHQNSDPLTIINLKYGLHVHPTRTNDYIWIPNNSHSIPNRITGGLVFKTNPFKNPNKYPGFSEFTKLNPYKPR